MRVTSEFWVSAYIRRHMAEGRFAAVGRRGASEAGAIAVKIAHLDGTASLYMPAPQMVFDDAKPQDRQFICTLARQAEADIDTRLSKEVTFDSDLWIIEVEQPGDDPLLDIARLDEDERGKGLWG
ncbi:DUF1491 family protein [Coralliovum pocilloporae]|uniref:DUF1491 family protein n=1 Tax=Coralliovum pocilloporae TaxID=3066369 RepID=UPI003306E529